MAGISTIERGARNWAKRLEAEGFDVDIDVFRTGPGGTAVYGPSYVEVTIERTICRGDEVKWVYLSQKFQAGPWASDDLGNDTWTNMKAAAIVRLAAEVAAS